MLSFSEAFCSLLHRGCVQRIVRIQSYSLTCIVAMVFKQLQEFDATKLLVAVCIEDVFSGLSGYRV